MSITIRPGHAGDSLAAYRVHYDANDDLIRRKGLGDNEAPPTEKDFQEKWQAIQSLYEHLARCAEHFWVAERDGEIVGYARSCNHEGVRELTEFFVHPSAQSQGVGKQLLARAFPPENARLRIIIASPEPAAQTLYMRNGVYARHLMYRFGRPPQAGAHDSGPHSNSDLQIVAAPSDPATLIHLGTIDRTILGFQRDDDHQWLMSDRQAWLYCRQGEVVGYGYTGARNGPFALLNGDDYPTVLAHAEAQAAAAGHAEFAMWVLSCNRYAIDYLLAERYKVSPFFAALLSDEPFGKLDHYINTTPAFFL